MKARDFVGMIKRDGWVLDRVKGSHHVYLHPTKPGAVVMKDAGLK
jgi:predicted RNA binding protein YcfA (HicA-like mRNA interferase family)